MIFISPDLHRFCEAVYRSGLPLDKVYRALSPEQAKEKQEEWRSGGIEATVIDLDNSAAELEAAIEKAGVTP